ncbi:MAG: hypothetical protein ACTS5I_05105, partial [Rhodanobacter sp.]
LALPVLLYLYRRGGWAWVLAGVTIPAAIVAGGGDGTINDGRELFGALSGDGFADLAAYDDDGNGWIDENDAVFSKLLIWSRHEDGTEQLRGLLQHGIGAIHLGQADTPFAIKDDSNALQGAVRATGIYLHEDGGVGTVQQIDLVV